MRLAVILVVVLLSACGGMQSMSNPNDFVSANRASLDSCTNFMLSNAETLFSCDPQKEATAVTMYPSGQAIQCTFIEQSAAIQNLLKTDIGHITFYKDNTIVFYFAKADFRNNRPFIIYSATKQPDELMKNIECYRLPELISDHYYHSFDNIGLAD